MDGWLRIKDVSEFCHVSQRTVRSWIKKDGLKISKIHGIVLVKIENLNRFLEQYAEMDNAQSELNNIVNDVLREIG